MFQNKSTYRIIFVVLSCLVFILTTKSSMAQGKTYNEEITVVAPFDPIIPDAFKISQNPVTDDTSTKVPTMNYDIATRIASVKPVIENLPPVKLVAEPISKLYRNYLRAGMGNYSALYGELFMSSLRSKQNLVTFHLKHQSASGSIKDYGSPVNSRNEAELTATKYFTEHTLTGKAYYTRDGLRLYGFKPSEFSDSVNKDDIKQHYYTAGLSTRFGSNYKSLDKLNHTFGLTYYHREGLYESLENSFVFSTSLNKHVELFKVGKNQMLGVNASYSFLNRHDSIGHINTGIVMLQPFVKAQVNEYSFMAGFKINVASDSITKGHLYPVAEARLELIPDALKLFAGLDGGMECVSLQSITAQNLFVSAVLPWNYVYDKFRIYGGFQSNISRSFNFNGSISSSTYSNYPLFVTDTNAYLLNSFTLCYDDISVVKLKAELEFVRAEHLHLTLNGTYSHYKTDAQQHAWYNPDYEFELSGRYDMQNKIAIKAKVVVEGPVWALKPATYPVTGRFQEPYILQATTLNGWADISLGGEYKFNKALSFWLNLNNLANSKYYRWYNYRSYGLNVMGGVSYSF